MIRKIYIAIICSFISVDAFSQITLTTFASGFSQPVDMKNCGDNRLFIVEQRGTIQIEDILGLSARKLFLDITDRVRNAGEQGLLGVAFPPDFHTTGYFYVDYVFNTDGHTHISRFHVDPATPDSADPASEEVLLSIFQPYSNHKGGDVAFGPDGYLYIGMGDGGLGGDPGNRAQNTDSLLGKILRIDVSSAPGYAIPASNPFAQDTSLGRGEIWAYGMRNPWRWSFDRKTGDLWIGDVGQNVIEEVDFQPANDTGGHNYGWRCYEANAVYDTSSHTCPPYSATTPNVYQYTHTGGLCSISGGYRYRGAQFQDLYGKYFFTDYCVSNIRYLEDNGSGGFAHTDLGNLGGSAIVAFGEDMNGEMYCSGINSGIVYHLISTNCAPVATINNGLDSITDCSTGSANLSVVQGPGYTYLWTLNGDTISTSSSFVANQAGMYILNVANQSCTNSDSVYVDFVAPLNLTFAGLDSVYCIYNSAVNLLPNYLGGTFTGAGMSGVTFNPAVAGVGNYTITYDYITASGCPYSYSQNVRVDACLGVADNLWTNTITIFPNPATASFTISVYTGISKVLQVNILDLAGRNLSREEFVLNNGINTIPVGENLSKGIYFVRMSDEISSKTIRVIVQ
jgi:glucose/arabinose dehydrogenase